MADFIKGRFGIIILIFLGFNTACSTTQPVTITETETSVGQKIVTEEDIPAVVYEFSNRIHSAYLDTLSGLFTLQFRDLTDNGKWLQNSGRIVVFDPDSSHVYWDYKLPYKRRNYVQYGSDLIEYTQTGGHFINLETGRREDSIKYYVYHIDPVHNIGMGYKISSLSRTPDTLFGFDMTSGEEIWERSIKSDYEWNDVTFLNDTTTVLVAGGLHTLDPRDGSGWSYDSKTGKKDYTASIAGTLAGVASGLLTGNYAVVTGHTLIADLVSNTLIDESSFTLATAEEVIKLDYSGDTIWTQPMDQKEASQSYIWEDELSIYMLNTGYARRNYTTVSIGKAFVAAFEKETGEEIYKTYLSEDDEYVAGFKESGNSVLLLFENRIAQFKLSEGEITSVKETDSLEKGSLAGFIGYQAFRKDGENVYYSITGHDRSNNYIITDEEHVLVLDHLFNHVETIRLNDLYIMKAAGEEHVVISSYDDTKSVLLDEEMMSIAEVDAGGDVYDDGESLYLVSDRKLVKLPLSDLR